MLTVLRCLNCHTAYDADERPAVCDVCETPLYGPAKPPQERADYWEAIEALFAGL